MVRLRHETSGVTVVVSEETAARLGREWQPVTDASPAAPRRTKHAK